MAPKNVMKFGPSENDLKKKHLYGILRKAISIGSLRERGTNPYHSRIGFKMRKRGKHTAHL